MAGEPGMRWGKTGESPALSRNCDLSACNTRQGSQSTHLGWLQ